MKTISTLIILIWFFPLKVLGDERNLPIDDQLPKIGNNWIRRDDDGGKDKYSWVNFDNKKYAGEVLSFVAWKVSPSLTVTSSPVGQASIETFLSNGSARYSTPKRGQPIRDTLRHRIVSIGIRANGFKRDVDAIEYTYVYESDDNSVVTMANGYCIVVGDTALFVQHTSPKVISSDSAFDMVGGLLAKHFQLTGKPYSFFKGKILRSNG